MSEQAQEMLRRRQFYLNQEIISERSLCFGQLRKLIDPLDDIYKGIKQQIQIEQRNNVFDVSDSSYESSSNLLQTEIFAFSKQSQTFYEAYGNPTIVDSTMLKSDSSKYLFIGTEQSVIIVIEVRNGRTDKVQAIFNSGENQRRYGSVTCLSYSNDGIYMICGFEKGDIQVFEVAKKWERISHVKGQSSIVLCRFINYQPGKVEFYEAISVDQSGQINRLGFSMVCIFDKIMVQERKETIFDKGSCVQLQVKPSSAQKLEQGLQMLQQNQKQSGSWWSATKSLFSNKDEKQQDKQSEGNFLSRTFSQNSPSDVDSESSFKVQHKKVYDSFIINQQELKYIGFTDIDFILLCVQYINKVEIIKIDLESKKNCSIIYSLMRNINISEEDWLSMQQSANLSWGEGYFNLSQQSAQCLLVRWGESFHLVKCLSIDDDLELVEGAYFRLNLEKASVVTSKFLTNNIIYYQSDDFQNGFVHTTQFQFIGSDDILNFDIKNRYRILSKEDIPPVKSLLVVEDQRFSELPEVSDTDYHQNSITSLKHGKLFLNKLKTWSNFLDELIQKNRWFEALQAGMRIYQGKLKILSKVPSSLSKRQNEMRQMMEKIAFTYVMFILKPLDINQSFSWEDQLNQIRLVIEFLITTDNSVFVLTVVKDFCRDQKMEKLFFTALEPFIINKMLNQIPASFLDDLIAYYRNSDKEVIQRLILQLDLQSSDSAALLQACVELQLFKALIYICNKQGDYLTFLIKLLALWDVRLNEEMNEKNNIDREFIKRDRVKMGSHILAYIRMCFRGRNLQGDAIPTKNFLELLRGLIIFMFVEENLKAILTVDCRSMLQLIFMLFGGKIREIVIQHRTIFRIQVPESSDQTNLFDNRLSNNHIEIMTYKKMFQMVRHVQQDFSKQNQYPCQKGWVNEKEIRSHFLLFYAKVIQLEFLHLSVEFKMEVTKEILQDPGFFTIVEEYSLELGQENLQELNENAFLINLVDSFIYQLNKTQLKELIDIDEAQKFDEFQAYLRFQNSQQIDAFNRLLHSRNLFVQKSIFEYLESIFIFEKKDSELQIQIRSAVINHSQRLLVVSEAQTFSIFKNYFVNQELQIINALSISPQSQLDYIRYILKTYDQQSINDEIRLIYIELLCKSQPTKVLEELIKGIYPIDDTLLICKKYNVIDAIAYLLQKAGAIQEALEMLSQLFFTKLRETLKNFIKIKQIRQEDQDEIERNLNLIIDLCSSSQATDESYQSLWYQFLESLFKENKPRTLADTKVPAPIRDILCMIVSDVFENMARHVEIENLLDKIHENYGSMPLRTFLKTNESIKNKFQFEATTLKLGIDLINKNYINYLLAIKMQLDQGTFMEGTCALCFESLRKSVQVIVFRCNHPFHYDCYLDVLGKDQESFNSLKVAKKEKACPVCLEDKSNYCRDQYQNNNSVKKTNPRDTNSQSPSKIRSTRQLSSETPSPVKKQKDETEKRRKELKMKALTKWQHENNQKILGTTNPFQGCNSSALLF